MQTFLPYPHFADSAKVLDRQRLGKQRVETLQIMKALLMGKGWVNHPATKMWAGYEWSLLGYQEAVCEEWVSRGYKDTCYQKTIDVFKEGRAMYRTAMHDPPWFGDYSFHVSHQSNLVKKDPEWYKPRFPFTEPGLPYIWPTN